MKSTCQKLNVLLIATRGVTDVDMLFTLNPVIVKGNYLSRQPTSYAVVVQTKRFFVCLVFFVFVCLFFFF